MGEQTTYLLVVAVHDREHDRVQLISIYYVLISHDLAYSSFLLLEHRLDDFRLL